MKRVKFYVCPNCGNVLSSTGEAEISCCGRKLLPLVAKPIEEEHKVIVEEVENDYYITFSHPIGEKLQRGTKFTVSITPKYKMIIPFWDNVIEVGKTITRSGYSRNFRKDL